jgi:hypothetical protein
MFIRRAVRNMIWIVVLPMASLTAASAQGITVGSDRREHPYPAEPQYQYPSTDQRARAQRNCPKGQALFQGRCRIVRRVH